MLSFQVLGTSGVNGSVWELPSVQKGFLADRGILSAPGDGCSPAFSSCSSCWPSPVAVACKERGGCGEKRCEHGITGTLRPAGTAGAGCQLWDVTALPAGSPAPGTSLHPAGVMSTAPALSSSGTVGDGLQGAEQREEDAGELHCHGLGCGDRQQEVDAALSQQRQRM